jgi:hypothetical protein
VWIAVASSFPEIAHVAHSRACNDPNWITLEQESRGTDFASRTMPVAPPNGRSTFINEFAPNMVNGR